MTRDRANLEAFMDLSEGDAPPVFAGRDAVLADILSVAASVWAGGTVASQGKPKVTRILQGAPGAGKSALLAELARRASDCRTNAVPIAVLLLNSADIGGPLDILKPLAERVDPAGAGKDFLVRVQTTRSAHGRLGAFGRAGRGGPVHNHHATGSRAEPGGLP